MRSDNTFFRLSYLRLNACSSGAMNEAMISISEGFDSLTLLKKSPWRK